MYAYIVDEGFRLTSSWFGDALCQMLTVVINLISIWSKLSAIYGVINLISI
jgi:hypothetical protein